MIIKKVYYRANVSISNEYIKDLMISISISKIEYITRIIEVKVKILPILVWQQEKSIFESIQEKSREGYTMKNQRLNEICNEIDSLIVGLLVPIRTSKSISRANFDKLYFLLDEILVILKDEENIPIKLSGKLFFIYKSMNSEAYHSRYPEPLFLELGNVENYLSRIFKRD